MQISKYEITSDKLNYVLREKFIGKERIKGKPTGETKDCLAMPKYFPTLDSMINYILNNEIRKAMNNGDIKKLEDIKTFFNDCKKEIIENIEFKNNGKAKNFFIDEN